jgi:hypothetical protein
MSERQPVWDAHLQQVRSAVTRLGPALRIADGWGARLAAVLPAGGKGADRPLVPVADRRRVLEAVEDVDAVVVFDEDTSDAVLRRLCPDVWVRGGDYAGSELPEASVLQEWCGQAVVMPYLPGRSTSELVLAARTTPTVASSHSPGGTP